MIVPVTHQFIAYCGYLLHLNFEVLVSLLLKFTIQSQVYTVIVLLESMYQAFLSKSYWVEKEV